MTRKLIYITVLLATAGGMTWWLYPGRDRDSIVRPFSKNPAEEIKLQEEQLHENPGDIPTLKRLVELHRMLGQHEQEFARLKELKELQPKDLEIRDMLIDFHGRQQQVHELIAELEALCRLVERTDPVDRERLANAYRRLATLYVITNQTDKRVTLLHKYCRLRPSNEQLCMEYIDVLLKSGQRDSLKDGLETAIVRFPQNTSLADGVMQLYLADKDYALAESFALERIEKAPSAESWELYLSVLQRQLDKNGKQQLYFDEYLRAFEDYPREIPLEPVLNLALESGELDFVAEALRRWKTLVPQSKEAWDYHLTRLLPRQKIKTVRRAELYVAAAREIPQRLSYKAQAARLYMEAEEWQKAIGLWKDLLKLARKDSYFMAYLDCLAQSDQQEYRRELIVAHNAHPSHKAIALRYADELVHDRNWRGILEIYGRQTEMAGSDFRALEATIAKLISDRQMNEAYTAAKAANAAFPKHDPFLQSCAEIAELQGRYAEAADFWQQLVDRHPAKIRFQEGQFRALSLLPDKSRFLAEVEAHNCVLPTQALLLDAAHAAQKARRYPLAVMLWDRLIAEEPEAYAHYRNRLECLKHEPELGHMKSLVATAIRFPDKPVMAQAILAKIDANAPIVDVFQLVSYAERADQQPVPNRIAMVQGYDYIKLRNKQRTLLNELRTEAPENKEVAEGLIQMHFANRIWDQARPLVLDLLAREPGNERYQALRRQLARQTREWSYLIPALNALLKEDPTNENALHELANYHRDHGKAEDAIDYFQRLHKLAPQKIRYRHELVDLLADAGRYEEAAALLDPVRGRLAPDRLILLAELYRFLGRLSKAQTLRNEIVEKTSSATVLASFGQKMVKRNLLIDAEKAYRKVLKINPKHQGALLALARLCTGDDRVPDAIRFYHRYLELRPNDPAMQIAIGEVEAMRGDYDQAAIHFDTALALLDKTEPLLRARALAGLGQVQVAIPEFEAAVEKNPENGYAWSDYADMLIRADRLDEAETVIDRAPKEQHLARNFSLLALAHQKQGHYGEAERLLRYVQRFYARRETVSMQLANVLEIRDNWHAALQEYRFVADSDFMDERQRSLAARKAKAITRDNRPRFDADVGQTENGDDENRLARVQFHSPLSPWLDLDADLHHRQLSGNGFTGYRNVDEQYSGLRTAFTVRPGTGFRYQLGLHYEQAVDDPIYGFSGELSYQEASWDTRLGAVWQDPVLDPVAVVPYDGAQDRIYWTWRWAPVDGFRVKAQADWTEQYLLNPPASANEDFFDSTTVFIDLEYRFAPQLAVFYRFSTMNGNQNASYDEEIDLIEKHRLNSLGLRFDLALTSRLKLTAAYATGHDDELDLAVEDYQRFRLGIAYRFSDTFECGLLHRNASESLTGTRGNHRETTLTITWRF